MWAAWVPNLLYPDDTIQHAGVGFGIGGVAGHLHKYFPATSDGYMGRLNYVQDVYGDTAACLLIRKEIYDEVHGLDESYAVAFNDVDFCVRVREAGYTNVFTPFAQLYHYESKSRGMEDNPEKQKRFQGEVLRFQARWGDLLAKGDPCTNPNFDIQREDFSLKILPLNEPLSHASRASRPLSTLVPPPPAGGVFPIRGALGRAVRLEQDKKTVRFHKMPGPAA